MTILAPAGSLFARLRIACAADWRTYVEHEFVRRLGDGTLPAPCFRRYLEQDYLFLIHFARAYALAAYKATALDDIREAAAAVSAIVDTEMRLHVRFCAPWGLSEAAMASLPEAPATLAYTRFVLEAGHAGDLLDLHVALAPCVVGYAEIATRLEAAGSRLAGNRYADWIAMYAGPEYQGVARAAVARLDRLGARLGAEARFASLAGIFRTATRLEADFWTTGLAVGGPSQVAGGN
jgi:thiaminase/transcriptional activator TenA